MIQLAASVHGAALAHVTLDRARNLLYTLSPFGFADLRRESRYRPDAAAAAAATAANRALSPPSSLPLVLSFRRLLYLARRGHCHPGNSSKARRFERASHAGPFFWIFIVPLKMLL